jgi:hypothetical protein
MLEDALGTPVVRGDLGQPDQRLDGLDLAEERPEVVEPVVAPVLKKPLLSDVTPH